MHVSGHEMFFGLLLTEACPLSVSCVLSVVVLC